MRRARVVLVAGILGGLLLMGCGTGTPTSQTRQVGTFERLQVDGSLDLDVSLSNRPEPGVRVSAGSKTIDRIRTEVRNGTLHIETKSRGLVIGPNPVGDVDISLGVPALAGVEVKGSSNLRLSGISAKELELRMTGDGELRVLGRADRIEVELDGSVDADLSRLAVIAAPGPHRRSRPDRPAGQRLARAGARGQRATSPTAAAPASARGSTAPATCASWTTKGVRPLESTRLKGSDPLTGATRSGSGSRGGA